MQVKMFNKQGKAWVYQWSSQSQVWLEVGEVAGPTGDGPGGLFFIENISPGNPISLHYF